MSLYGDKDRWRSAVWNALQLRCRPPPHNTALACCRRRRTVPCRSKWSEEAGPPPRRKHARCAEGVDLGCLRHCGDWSQIPSVCLECLFAKAFIRDGEHVCSWLVASEHGVAMVMTVMQRVSSRSFICTVYCLNSLNQRSLTFPTPETTGVGGGGVQGVQTHPQSFWYGKNPGKIWGNLCKICVNLRQIAVCALILQKWHPKINFFCFWNHVLIRYFRASEGKFKQVLVKFGQKWCLNCLYLKKCAQWNAVFFWRDSFSGKLAEIWEKILRTPKN